MAEYNKAEQYLTKSLRMYESILGNINPELNIPLNNLGLLYIHQNKLELAKKYFNRALTIMDHVFDFDHPIKIILLIIRSSFCPFIS